MLSEGELLPALEELLVERARQTAVLVAALVAEKMEQVRLEERRLQRAPPRAASGAPEEPVAAWTRGFFDDAVEEMIASSAALLGYESNSAGPAVADGELRVLETTEELENNSKKRTTTSGSATGTSTPTAHEEDDEEVSGAAAAAEEIPRSITRTSFQGRERSSSMQAHAPLLTQLPAESMREPAPQQAIASATPSMREPTPQQAIAPTTPSMREPKPQQAIGSATPSMREPTAQQDLPPAPVSAQVRAQRAGDLSPSVPSLEGARPPTVQVDVPSAAVPSLASTTRPNAAAKQPPPGPATPPRSPPHRPGAPATWRPSTPPRSTNPATWRPGADAQYDLAQAARWDSPLTAAGRDGGPSPSEAKPEHLFSSLREITEALQSANIIPGNRGTSP